MLRVYRHYAFKILKKYRRRILGRKRLTMKLLDSIYTGDKQFYLLPFDNENDVKFDPYGIRLEQYLKKKVNSNDKSM